MDNPRILGEASDYMEIIEIFRKRAAELKLTREAMDALTGLQSGYSSKLFCSQPIRRLGRESWGPVLQGLGMRLLFVEDPKSLARFSKQMTKSNRVKLAPAKPKSVKYQISLKKLRRMARVGGENRAKKLSAKKRQMIARKGGMALQRKNRERARARIEAGRAARRSLKALPPSQGQDIPRLQSAGIGAPTIQGAAQFPVRQE